MEYTHNPTNVTILFHAKDRNYRIYKINPNPTNNNNVMTLLARNILSATDIFDNRENIVSGKIKFHPLLFHHNDWKQAEHNLNRYNCSYNEFFNAMIIKNSKQKIFSVKVVIMETSEVFHYNFSEYTLKQVMEDVYSWFLLKIFKSWNILRPIDEYEYRQLSRLLDSWNKK